MSTQASHQIQTIAASPDRLSALPDELLSSIFQFAHEVERPTGPLSKHLLPFYEKSSFGSILLWSTSHFPKFEATIIASPRFGKLVERFAFEDCETCTSDEGDSINTWDLGEMNSYLERIIPLLPSIRYLDLRDVPGSPAGALTRLTSVNALSNLRFLEFCLPSSPGTVNLTTLDFAADLPSLRALRLSLSNFGNPSDIIHRSHSRFANLDSLRLDVQDQITKNLLDELIQTFPTISQFSLDIASQRFHFLDSLQLLPSTLKSLRLDSWGRYVPRRIDSQLLHFASLISVELIGGIFSENLHLALLELKTLEGITLSFHHFDPTRLKQLVHGPNRLPRLRFLTVNYYGIYPVWRVESPLAIPGTSGFRYMSRGAFKVDMSDADSPDPEDFDHRAVKDLISAAEENGVVIGGGIEEALPLIEEYFLEANNRAVIHAYDNKNFSFLKKYRQEAAKWDVSLPDFDLDSLGYDLEFIETKLPDRDWFILSLQNKKTKGDEADKEETEKEVEK